MMHGLVSDNMSTGGCSIFAFENGYAAVVIPHSLNCASIEVYPSTVVFDVRPMTTNEVQMYGRVEPYYWPHCSDKQIVERLAKVLNLPTEPHMARMDAEARKLADDLIAKARARMKDRR